MRARYTIDEIQQAALEIVDRDGLGGLTMRSLASALGTGPMTLYNYVQDREHLEGLVADAVIASVRRPKRSADWRQDVTAIVTAIWQAMRAHPAAVPLVLVRRTVSSTSYDLAETLITALARSGLSDADLLAAFRAVLAFVMGSAQSELAAPDRDAEAHATAAGIGVLAGEAHPAVEALSAVSRKSTAKADFTRGLAMLLAGIAASAA
ncbi:TetR/AcrR family transcriptional regulator [Kutzneria sp. CA-103260]|uniref:TetR/AcrR family transcriptional regulator n=1 Tax=Kutzneria sp. CA-103260 TaxID=2802641 RepID=UPI001BA72BB7|nr:TetR/AcrR family transcriptional regulator C-terminal domain-containing protein [Kutzneria sp. CA-103260]QUQ67118.1 transcriptional regulator [Kutzneria sp. CA-103260]